jgi:hypothetical protein
MFTPKRFLTLLSIAAILSGCGGAGGRFRGVLREPKDFTTLRQPGAPSDEDAVLKTLKAQGFNAVVARVDEETPSSYLLWLPAAARRVGLAAYLWIDVGRNPRLADRHPEWIAGMGMHEDWRRLFPDAPRPKAGERIGVYPWTPIWYREVLEDRRQAILRQLRGRTEGLSGVFLNQVQGSPSACGCGNDQCRWTVDYRMQGGPETVEEAPAAHLISLLEKELPGVAWIPVWVPECEEVDMGPGSTGYCGTVGCFKGLCWKESTRELEPLVSGPMAVLLARDLFHRHLARYDPQGGWWHVGLRELEEIPPRNGHPGLARGRVTTVVEGRPGAGPREKGVCDRALEAGAGGVLVSEIALDESWEPRIIPAARKP